MIPGYPKDLYARDGSFITVQNQYEEEEYAARGWTTTAPRPAAPAKVEDAKSDELKDESTKDTKAKK